MWLAIEVSSTVDEHDVERASRRDKLLKKAGYRSLPVAAKEEATPEAEKIARIEKVALMRDGQPFLWQETVEA